MAELYWGDKRVIGIKPPGGEYIALIRDVVLKGFHVDVPEGTTTIGPGSFNSCYNLKSIHIPNSVTTLDRSAFDACTGLETIVIPSSVTSIASSCFRNCSSLSKIFFEGDPPTIDTRALSGLANVTIYHKATNLNWTAEIKTSSYGGAYNVIWETY